MQEVTFLGPLLNFLLYSCWLASLSNQVVSSGPFLLPPLPTDLGLQAMPKLKKRRSDHELEEGELAPRNDNRQQKVAKDPRDKKGASVDSRDETEVRRPQRTWAP